MCQSRESQQVSVIGLGNIESTDEDILDLHGHRRRGAGEGKDHQRV